MLFLALPLGFVCGLRVFTPPAVLYLVLRGGWTGIALAICAVGEFVADALPIMPPRTAFPSPFVRILSGGFCGAMLAGSVSDSAGLGCVLGIIGAAAGTYAGFAWRMRLISAIHAIPAALVEDAAAILLAVAIVLR